MRTKYLFMAFVLIGSILNSGCKETKKDPDPLENAAGVYKGSVADGATIYQNIQANVTVEKWTDGALYIKSVGLTGTSYQLVLTNPSPAYGFNGKRGSVGYSAYAQDVSVSGGTLNVKGYIGSGTTTAFSFTGTKQ